MMKLPSGDLDEINQNCRRPSRCLRQWRCCGAPEGNFIILMDTEIENLHSGLKNDVLQWKKM